MQELSIVEKKKSTVLPQGSINIDDLHESRSSDLIKAVLESGQLLERSMLQHVRDEMEAVARLYVAKHIHRILAIREFTEFNNNQKLRKEAGLDYEPPIPMPPPVPPLLLNATVGVGKSVLVQRISELCKEHDLPLAVMASTHDLCGEHIDKNAAQGMRRYRGRVDPENDKDTPENICYKLKDTEKAGENNHRVAASLCRKCEHGHAAAITYDTPGKEVAIQWFAKQKQDPKKIKPCCFLYVGLKKTLAEKQISGPTAAFSDAIGIYKEGKKETQRLVVIDEHADLGQEIKVQAGDVDIWIGNIDTLKDRLERNKADEDDSNVSIELAEILSEVRDVFCRLHKAIRDNEDINETEIVNIKIKVAKAYVTWGGTARWESITQTDEGYHMPLRALNSIAANIDAKSLRRTAKALYFYELKPLLMWAIERGSLIILDATASKTTKAVIQAADGQIYDRMIKQNIKVTQFSGHLYGRGMVKSGSYQHVAESYINEIKKIAKLYSGLDMAFITHKCYLDHAIPGKTPEEVAASFQADTGCPVGWFGRHDRGHNQWSGRNIAAVGMTILPQEAIASKYAGCRAVLMQACRGECDWPIWDGVMQDEKTRKAGGGVPLPANDFVRKWLIDDYAASTTQIIGRARAINAKTELKALLFGGLQGKEMNAALLSFGIIIDEVIENKIHRSARTMSDEETMLAAVKIIKDSGGSVSKTAVRAALTKLGSTMKNDKILVQLAALRGAGKIPPASRGRPANKP